MNYDHWKTTEPEASEELQQCCRCKRILPFKWLWFDQSNWICEDCIDPTEDDAQ